MPQGTIRSKSLQVGGYVQGESVGGDTAGDMHPQSGDLLFGDLPPRERPDTGATSHALGEDPIISAGTNQHLLQFAQVVDDADWWGKAAQTEDGVADQLARGRGTSHPLRDWFRITGQCHAGPARQSSATTCARCALRPRVRTGGCSSKQQNIANLLLLAQSAHLLLESQGLGKIHAAEMDVQKRPSRVLGL